MNISENSIQRGEKRDRKKKSDLLGIKRWFVASVVLKSAWNILFVSENLNTNSKYIHAIFSPPAMQMPIVSRVSLICDSENGKERKKIK